jgi:ABC-type multidrug transport system fused ATPase/permease subunit
MQSSLEARLQRLQARLERLQQLDRRFSWYRLGVFLTGLAAVWISAAYLGAAYARWVILIALLSFAAVVFLHRRLDRWRTTLAIWTDALRTDLARLRLDWEHIPPPETLRERAPSPLELDLDLTGQYSLHHLIDQCISQEGSRLLAGWLSTPEPDATHIRSRQALIRELAHARRFRQRLHLNLKLVSKEPLSGAGLLDWMQVEHDPRRALRLLAAAGLLAALNLSLFALNSAGWIPAFWPFSLSIYLAFYFFNAGSLTPFLEAVLDLDRELDKLNVLLCHVERANLERYPNLMQLCAPFQSQEHKPTGYIRKIKLVTAAIGLRMNPILGLMINLVLPWDFLFAWLAGLLRQRAKRLLPGWLETLYRLDGLASLGGFADLHPDYTFPEISPASTPLFQATALAHPLIPAPRRVGNDFAISSAGETILITGSNMAGKSTFIRTVGLNLCLAYAGAPVCAAYLRTAAFRLHTCIRISDSITDGFSYFYAEVKCLRGLLEKIRTPHSLPVLYLIDEIYRGTNNRERFQGSRALIQALSGANGVGLIATHDLELAGLADGRTGIVNFHFRDQVEAGRLVFDYLIRPGPCPTTNALKIMQLEGLPVQ